MAAGWRLDAVMPELTRRAVQFVREQERAERPFFLYFPFTSPHAPIVPAKQYQGVSGAGPFGDFVAQSDASVGAVLAALDKAGLADNTLVIFSADNGPEAYAYERMQKFGHKSPGELRGVKRDVWEGGHRVPMIVRWPGVVAANQRSDALVGQVDLMATLAGIVGAALPDDQAEDSFDLMPLWRGAESSVRYFLVHNTYAQKLGIRRGKWLLLNQKDGTHNRTPKWVLDSYAPNEHELVLCDLEQDPSQRSNVCAQHPEVVLELVALLQDVRDRGYSAPRLANEQ